MKVTARSSLIAILLLPFFYSSTHAASLSQASLRLDRLKTGSSLSGYICATPANPASATEGKVTIQFPQDFTLDTNTLSWSTSTSSLPSGSTAWPGSLLVESISSNEVTIQTGNLTSSSLYCFRFTGGSSTLGGIGKKSFTIITKTSSGTVIDAKSFVQTITSNDEVSLTATVPANSSDYTATLVKSSPASNSFQPGNVITYELSYNTSLQYNSAITVEAEWTLGTIEGSSTPNVEILNYVTHSATKGYNDASPVINITNRKISWTIPAFSHTPEDQTVSFQLSTNQAYSGTLSFSVKGRVIGPGTQTSDSTVTSNYTNTQAAVTATPTNQQTSTSITHTPTPTPVRNRISTISIDKVLNDTATIRVITTKPSLVTVEYGTSPTLLNQRVTSSTMQLSHLISLPQLKPNTSYYFRLYANDKSTPVVVSDIFTLITAIVSSPPTVDPESLLVIGNQNLLFNNQIAKSTESQPIVLSRNADFQFSFSFQDARKIKRIQLSFVPQNVLGIQSSPSSNGEMTEVRPGVYSVKLNTDLHPGTYDLVAKIYDEEGNIISEKLGEIRIVKPLTVLDKETRKPIERAYLALSFFDESKKIFSPVSSQQLSLPSPLITTVQGELNISLPPGIYRTEIRALGYKTQTVDFSIGIKQGDEYPTILLEPDSYNLVTSATYIKDISTEFVSSLDQYIRTLILSFRFFHLVNFLVVILFILLTLVSFSSKIGLPFSHIPHYTISHMKKIMSRKDYSFHGRVIDAETRLPLKNVHIFLLNHATSAVIDAGITDKNGVFSLVKPKHAGTLLFVKNNYLTSEEELALYATGQEHTYVLNQDTISAGLTRIIKNAFIVISERFFEVLLFITILFEILLGRYFGFNEALPFLTISAFNLFLYMYHSHQTRL